MWQVMFTLIWSEWRQRLHRRAFAWLAPLFFPMVATALLSVIFWNWPQFLRFRRYPAFLLAGIVPWQFMASCVTSGANSLVRYQRLVGRFRFPRAAIPLSVVVIRTVSFAFGFLVLCSLLSFTGQHPASSWAWLPVIFAAHLALVCGLALGLSIAHAYWRDVGGLIPGVMLLWLFASPVFYSVSSVPGEIWKFYRFNPMVGILSGYRNVLLKHTAPDPELFAWACVVSALVLAAGIFFFRRYEPNVADTI